MKLTAYRPFHNTFVLKLMHLLSPSCGLMWEIILREYHLLFCFAIISKKVFRALSASISCGGGSFLLPLTGFARMNIQISLRC